MVAVAVLTGTIGAFAVGPTPDGRPVVDDTDFPTRLHAAGIDGSNVSVGVIDATGYDTDRIAARVVATATFETPTGPEPVSRDDHGTATALTVSRIAPGANLYLATVDSPAAFVSAVSWLRERDVDVIVAPVTFRGRAGTGRSPVARAAARAVEAGVVVVAPTGNHAGGHWEGPYAPVRNGTLGFETGTRNWLVDTDAGDRLRVWLSWDRAHADRNFTVELYRADGAGGVLIARSHPVPGDAVPNERLTAELGPGRYFLTIRGPANPGRARLELTSPTHRFRHELRNGTVRPPATARGVIGVGGIDPRDGRVEPFSARGPTRDGRRGVDLVAPDRLAVPATDGPFVGTSAAAAYVAGVAALVLDAAPDATPRAVRRYLTETASDAGPTGVDPITGHGQIDPVAAVAAARSRDGSTQTAS